jgi:hypothetical protein
VTAWLTGELDLLRSFWPDLEYEESGSWVLKRNYLLPDGWSHPQVDLAFRIPPNLPAEQPYGFWVRNGLQLASGGLIGNYQFPSEPVPFSSDQWGKFSWSPEHWRPGTAPGLGDGMVHFVESFRRRLEELS